MKLIILIFFNLIAIYGYSQWKINEEDKIKIPEALDKYQKGQVAHGRGIQGWDLAEVLLNQADSLEPNNPMILAERGSFRLHSRRDIDGGIQDCKLAFELARTQRLKEAYALNLGLSYMSLGDIESACKSWRFAGLSGKNYIIEYRGYIVKEVGKESSDKKIDVSLTLVDTIAFITSRLNSPSMSKCDAVLLIKNVGYKSISVTGSSFEYGLKNEGMNLYLEAIDEEGKPVSFFTQADYHYLNPNPSQIIPQGESFSQEVDLTFVHHFFKPGNYKVRIALRNASGNCGFEGIYYSNWVDLNVEYKIEPEDGF